MGHDFVTLRGAHVHLHDADILYVWYLLDCEARVFGSEDGRDELVAFIQSMEAWGPGVHKGLDLTEYVGDSEVRRERLLALLRATGDRLRSYGPELSVETRIEIEPYLAKPPFRESLGPYPTGQIQAALEAIVRLVEANQ
jgi:hypothetical protein